MLSKLRLKLCWCDVPLSNNISLDLSKEEAYAYDTWNVPKKNCKLSLRKVEYFQVFSLSPPPKKMFQLRDIKTVFHL